MTSDARGNPDLHTLNAVVEQIQHQQAAGAWASAIDLLAMHAVDLVDRLPTAELAALFAPFPRLQLAELPALWFVAGLIETRLHHVAAALAWLEKAAIYFTTQDVQPERAIWVNLELARLHYAHDEFAAVQQHIDVAVALMKRHPALPTAHEAFLNYMIASLCGDTGRVAEGMGFARRAAQQYHRQRNHAREFRAWLTVCSFANQLGVYQAALDALHRARICYESQRLESADFEALLNAETHLAWYRGRLEEALNTAQLWVRFTQGSGFHRQRLYAHWMMGNILRALGRYDQAFDYYELTRRIALEHAPNFVRWVDAQQSWLAVLQADYPAAEQLILCALDGADYGQTMSFLVSLGVIELSTGRQAAAEQHLREALAFYTQSQDRQATCAIAFHLAYIQIERGAHTVDIARSLRAELKWLEGEDNAYFPLWWHPPIVSRVAGFLWSTPEFRGLARRFFRQQYLGEAGVRALCELHRHAPTGQRAELAELLAVHGATAPETVETHGDAERVITAAVEQGLLTTEMVPALFRRLRTARHRDRDNPTITAIFLLHIQGVTAGDIALQLDISRSSVSHMLQAIYESLGVVRNRGSRIEQRHALHRAAQAEGLII